MKTVKMTNTMAQFVYSMINVAEITFSEQSLEDIVWLYEAFDCVADFEKAWNKLVMEAQAIQKENDWLKSNKWSKEIKNKEKIIKENEEKIEAIKKQIQELHETEIEVQVDEWILNTLITAHLKETTFINIANNDPDRKQLRKQLDSFALKGLLKIVEQCK